MFLVGCPFPPFRRTSGRSLERFPLGFLSSLQGDLPARRLVPSMSSPSFELLLNASPLPGFSSLVKDSVALATLPLDESCSPPGADGYGLAPNPCQLFFSSRWRFRQVGAGSLPERTEVVEVGEVGVNEVFEENFGRPVSPSGH